MVARLTRGVLNETSYYDDLILIVERKSGKTIQTLPSPPNTTHGIFSPDNNYFAIGEYISISIYYLSSGTLIKKLDNFENSGPVQSLIFSNDSTKIALGYYDKHIIVRDIASGNYLHDLLGHYHNPNLCFSKNDEQLAYATSEKTNYYCKPTCLKIYNLASKSSQSISGFKKLGSFCFSPDGKYVAAADYNGVIGIWDFELAEFIRLLTTENKFSSILSLKYTPDSSLLIANQDYHMDAYSIDFWHIVSGVCIKRIPVPSTIRISQDDQQIITQSGSDTMMNINFSYQKFNYLQNLSAPQAIVFKYCTEALLNNKKIILSKESMKFSNALPKKIRKHFDRYLTSSWCSLI